MQKALKEFISLLLGFLVSRSDLSCYINTVAVVDRSFSFVLIYPLKLRRQSVIYDCNNKPMCVCVCVQLASLSHSHATPRTIPPRDALAFPHHPISSSSSPFIFNTRPSRG